MIRGIVLAAGKGTRMKSARPKVLHDLCGRPMLWYVLRALRDAGVPDVTVVSNAELDAEMAAFEVVSVVQNEQRGTGHAVRIALERMEPRVGGRVLIVYGDMPLVTGELLLAALAALDGENGDGAALGLVTVKMPLPSNFGRIVREGRDVARIVEVRDATPEELASEEMNAGIYAFDENDLRDAVPRLRDDNAQGEFYLTDAVDDFVTHGKRVRPVPSIEHLDVLGVNDRVELARARREMNRRLCERHMLDGVTILDPEATYLEPELIIGRDATIYPNTTISRLSEIGERCAIGPNVRLSNAKIGDRSCVRESVISDSAVGADASVGPYAHVRDGASIGDGVRVGNFVEIKNSRLARGSKASHLSYVGDAEIGERANLGAGTITCNYDGAKKHRTVVGADASIGSNSSLIAPVTIGDGALTGAGSVVTRDVAPRARVAGNPARPLPSKSETGPET